MTMLTFDRDVNIPQALMLHPYYMTPQTTAEISPCIKLGKESSAFQAAWRQGRM